MVLLTDTAKITWSLPNTSAFGMSACTSRRIFRVMALLEAALNLLNRECGVILIYSEF